MDTRTSLGGSSRLRANGTATMTVVTADVAAAASVPVNAVTAAVINLTSVNAAGPGYVTAWPAGRDKPATSVLNTTHNGHTLANLVTVPVGGSGAISIYSQAGGDLIVDVEGVYVTSTAATSGRLVPTTSSRVFDSRDGAQPLAAGASITLTVAPPMATAAVLNVTVTDALGPGFVTVWRGGEPRPIASNLNIEHAGQTVANAVIAAVTNGQILTYVSGGGHLIVDVVGYITGANGDGTSTASTAGLFVPVAPTRLMDSRDQDSPTAGHRPGAGARIVVPTTGVAGVPANGTVGSVALNLTMTESAGAGFATAWPARTAQPRTSSLNTDRIGQTVSNHVITPVSPDGVSVFTSTPAHVVVDITGYWIGAPTPTTEDAADDPPPNDVGPPVPPSPPTVGTHEFLHKIHEMSGTTPIERYARWNPCAPIRYLVNDDRATPTQRAILAEAISELEAATGMDLLEVGHTTEGLDLRVPANTSGATAVIVFSDEASSPDQLKDPEGVVRYGIGGGYSSGDRIVKGWAMFDTQAGEGDDMREVVLHELGHMIGLDHVSDQTQVMRTMAKLSAPGLTHYADGDREGLWRLGAAMGCL